MATILGPLNTVTLAAGVAQQLVSSVRANWYMQILNQGPGELGIGGDNTVAPGAANSYTLAPNQEFTGAPVWGPSGRWVAADQDGAISVALIPIQG